MRVPCEPREPRETCKTRDTCDTREPREVVKPTPNPRSFCFSSEALYDKHENTCEDMNAKIRELEAYICRVDKNCDAIKVALSVQQEKLSKLTRKFKCALEDVILENVKSQF